MTDDLSYFFVLKAFITNKNMSLWFLFINLMSNLLTWGGIKLDELVDLTPELFKSFTTGY